MRIKKIFLILILIISTMPIRAESLSHDNFSPYIETFTLGRIDWDNGLIHGVGRAYLDKNGTKLRALRAARVVASGNILKLAAGMRLDDRHTLESLGRGEIAIQLQAFLKVENETRQLIQGKRPYYEVTQTAPIKGVEGLTSKLFSHLKSKQVDWMPPPQHQATPPEMEDKNGPWLVLDARKFAKKNRVKPALLPKVLTPGGRLVYSSSQVSAQALVKRGMVSYVTSDKTLKQLQAATGISSRMLAELKAVLSPAQAYAKSDKKRPRKKQQFIVKEVKEVQGLMNTNLVITEKDANQLKTEDASSRILKNCRVIVVVSTQISGIEGNLMYYLSKN